MMTILASAGIIGIILAFISKKFREALVVCLEHVAKLFFKKVELDTTLGPLTLAYMKETGFKFRSLTGESYGETNAYVKPEKKTINVLFRNMGYNATLVYGKCWPIFITGWSSNRENNRSYDYPYSLWCLRWSVNFPKLLGQAVDHFNEKPEEESNRFIVKRVSGTRFMTETDEDTSPGHGPLEDTLANPTSSLVPLKWSKDDIGEEVTYGSLEQLSLSQELLDLVEEVRFWYNNREWYEERGIPWRLGLLFRGKPGTGKTVFGRAIAEEMNMPMYSFDLASMDNDDLNENWDKIPMRSIVLCEDFDAVFNGRKNVAAQHGSDGITFDCFLNCIDGANKKAGVLLIITTNHPETLDPALWQPEPDEVPEDEEMPSRPGRIDRAIEFMPLDEIGRMKLALRILKDESLAKKMVDLGKHDSAAQIQERCRRIALAQFFGSKK